MVTVGGDIALVLPLVAGIGFVLLLMLVYDVIEWLVSSIPKFW